MPRLFSYVVDHDYGLAPNPFGGFCTLAKCKYRKERSQRRNIVELADVGDWMVGTGGMSKASAGRGKLIYAMRVDEKLTLADYFNDTRFQGRSDNTPDESHRIDRFVLISRHFFYFGRNAIDIGAIPTRHLTHPLEKKGPGFRSNFSEAFIKDFAEWLERNYEIGVHGEPCGYKGKSSVRIRVSSQKVGANPYGCPPGQAQDLPLPQDIEKIRIRKRGQRKC
jgi:hypothetical protein